MNEEYAKEIKEMVDVEGIEIAIATYGSNDVYEALEFTGVYEQGDYEEFRQDYL